MTGLLELREKIREIYSHNEVLIMPVIKFLLALVVLNVINGHMGYMTQAGNIAVVLIVALMCSFLPSGAIIFFAAVFSLLHMYALSMEIALVGVIVYALLFMVFLRFHPKDSLVVVITPVLFALNIPYVVPIVMGLLGTPMSAITVVCGVIVYYLNLAVTGSASVIGTLDDGDVTAKVRLIIDGLLDNKAMLVVAAAFAITVIVVYLIRRMSVDYSWTIAIVSGVMLNLVILLIGDLIYDTNVSVIGAILGAVLAIAVAKVIEFFKFCVDYSRTEKVQFEDDEYYYYVKAVPKMSVAAPDKMVKQINTRTRNAAGRTVTTERIATARRTSGYGQPAYNGYRERLNGAKSVTIGSDSENMSDDSQDGFEEIF